MVFTTQNSDRQIDMLLLEIYKCPLLVLCRVNINITWNVSKATLIINLDSSNYFSQLKI